ncbi:hypothetical protein, partial [Roseomonas mucosa]
MQDRDPSSDPPAASPERPRAATEIERQERLARALRENLRRRKAQGRARAAQETGEEASQGATRASSETA